MKEYRKRDQKNVETGSFRSEHTRAAEGRAAVPLLFLAIPAEMGYTVGEVWNRHRRREG